MNERPFDRQVFDSGMIRIGAFRCDPDHPSFHDTGPTENYCFVFPRTAVEIQLEHEGAFVANPNVVTFYNRGQEYRRNAISRRGDLCDWFGVEAAIARDAVRAFDPSVDDRPDAIFRFSRGWSDASSYLLQRRLFDRVTQGTATDPLEVEELVVMLLERVLRHACEAPADPSRHVHGTPKRQRDLVHDVERLLSGHWDKGLRLRDLASAVGVSVFHLCRTFRRATGTTLHQYRHSLRVRSALEAVCETDTPLTSIALDTGFSSHSHFTSSFRQEFGQPPSEIRGR